MKDIARDLGVSVLQSLALKDSPRLSDEKREAIKKYAQEHNFYQTSLQRVSKVQPIKIIGDHSNLTILSHLILSGYRRRGLHVAIELWLLRVERTMRTSENLSIFFESKVWASSFLKRRIQPNTTDFQTLIDEGVVPLVSLIVISTGVNASRVVVDDYMGPFPPSHIL